MQVIHCIQFNVTGILSEFESRNETCDASVWVNGVYVCPVMDLSITGHHHMTDGKGAGSPQNNLDRYF